MVHSAFAAMQKFQAQLQNLCTAADQVWATHDTTTTLEVS